jgi:hypothetical protein
MKQQTINDHYDQQTQALIALSEKKSMPISEILKLKEKYRKRCVSLLYLGMYARKFSDGTDEKIYELSKKRKSFYNKKLLSVC